MMLAKRLGHQAAAVAVAAEEEEEGEGEEWNT